jgi:flagellar FliL protein
MIMVVAGVLVLGAGAGAGWYFSQGAIDAPTRTAKKKKSPSAPPQYVPVESFTVNLQRGEDGDHYLQVQFTLQVEGADQVELIKANMAQVRNRVLLLLSGKQAAEISTVEGKRQLASEILATVQEPFVERGDPQDVTDVLFTSFIIQ